MASGLSVSAASQDSMRKGNEEKSSKNSWQMNSSNVERTLDIPERPISLEDIQIHLLEGCSTPDQGGYQGITNKSKRRPREITSERSSSLLENAPGEEKEKQDQQAGEESGVVRQRRIGVVEASDQVVAERINARVLRKRFGEGSMISEIPWIFNKKL